MSHKVRPTPQLEHAIEHARKAAARFGHPCVSSVHLVLGLLMVGRGVAAILKSAGVTRDSTEQYLAARRLRAEQTQQEGDILFGTSAMLALNRAANARQSGPPRCRFVGTDHLLLALCHEKAGNACDLFVEHNVDRAQMRRLLHEKLAEPWPPDFEKVIDDIESPLNGVDERKD
jgi:ATP-dependent Clp protease ATP-binding subunit ClpC